MEFWGVEVKSGQSLDVTLGEDKVLHLSQACIGELKKDKSTESVCLRINIDGKKLVLGTLHTERLPQQLFDLVLDRDFQLSHNWKNGSVYFYGYRADQPFENDEDSDEDDSEEDDAIPLPVGNGTQVAKKEDKPVGAEKTNAAKGSGSGSGSGKQKVKIVEPEKEIKPDENDSDDTDDSDDSMSDDSESEEENDEDSSDDEDDEDSDEQEETPKKQQSGKKRPNESAMKTPSADKKAKNATTTGGKKGGGHVDTPHPSKQAGKTPANKSNQKSPATDGAYACKACNKNFKSENALQSHNQAKHK